MEIFTIGFTKRSAAQFFETLKTHGIELLIDVRLNNESQLAGFTKRDDLAYFLKTICNIDYLHEPRLAPTQEIMQGYRSKELTWAEYERKYVTLLAERRVEDALDRSMFQRRAVLLCSEATADNCHRRLALEYLGRKWGGIEIVHL